MRIFLSSTYEDLALHRQKAAQAIERLGQQGVRMEVFGARPSEAAAVCFDEIEESDALVGIYAHRYGYVPLGAASSITEQEFDFARAKEKPVLCFMVENDCPWLPRHIEGEPGRSKLEEFKERVRKCVVTDIFSSPEDLAYKLASSLGRFLLARKVTNELDKISQVDKVSTPGGRSQVARRAARLQPVVHGSRVLLVNDVPGEMEHVVHILRELRLEVDIARTSQQGLDLLAANSYDLVISDMQRDSVDDEGIRFLRRMRQQQLGTPVIFTVGRFDPGRGTPPYAFGITNRVDELLNLAFDALERGRG